MTDMKWYEREGPEGDIAVSTRVRLARNLSDTPFPDAKNPDGSRASLDRIAAAMFGSDTGESFRLVDLTAVSNLEAVGLMERHLISPEFAEKKGPRGVLLSEDDGVAVMINEEDHLRIQALAAGLSLSDRLGAARRVDEAAEDKLPIAFDEKLGYLTKCPTNLGTGLRASAMLHLPALTDSGAIRQLSANAGKLGFAVRGLFGEGSTAKGALYQISNQTTLGFDEETITTRLEDVIGQFIAAERKTRAGAVERDGAGLSDRVWRAVGILAYARAISSDETMMLLSNVRLGTSLGMLEAPGIPELNRLLWEIQPANLLLGAGIPPDEADSVNRDALRAEKLRGIFSKL